MVKARLNFLKVSQSVYLLGSVNEIIHVDTVGSGLSSLKFIIRKSKWRYCLKSTKKVKIVARDTEGEHYIIYLYNVMQ